MPVSEQMTLAVRFWTSILTAAGSIETRPLLQSLLHTYELSYVVGNLAPNSNYRLEIEQH